MKARGVFYFGKYLVLGAAFLALFTYVVMLLWNWLVPELFNGPLLSYWQTLGILVLSKILFAGLGNGHRRSSSWKSSTWGDRNCGESPWKHDHYRSYWKKKFEEKMNSKAAGQEGETEPAGSP
jgi:hypothetical protein